MGCGGLWPLGHLDEQASLRVTQPEGQGPGPAQDTGPPRVGRTAPEAGLGLHGSRPSQPVPLGEGTSRFPPWTEALPPHGHRSAFWATARDEDAGRVGPGGRPGRGTSSVAATRQERVPAPSVRQRRRAGLRDGPGHPLPDLPGDGPRPSSASEAAPASRTARSWGHLCPSPGSDQRPQRTARDRPGHPATSVPKRSAHCTCPVPRPRPPPRPCLTPPGVRERGLQPAARDP